MLCKLIIPNKNYYIFIIQLSLPYFKTFIFSINFMLRIQLTMLMKIMKFSFSRASQMLRYKVHFECILKTAGKNELFSIN